MSIEEIIKKYSNLGVTIRSDILNIFIDFLKSTFDFSKIHPYDWSDNNFWLEKSLGPQKVSQYFSIGNSINFKFWDFKDDRISYVEGIKGGLECKGSSYMWRCLKVCIENNTYPILNAYKLSRISLDNFKKIFETDSRENIMTCIDQRWLNLKNLGLMLENEFKGLFYNLIIQSDNSIIKFMKLSKKFRAFDDPIYKLTMVNAILHQGRGLTTFKNIYPGIDYHLITQVLRIGLLKLDKKLEKKLIKRQLLSHTESLILRSQTLRCLNQISKELNTSGDIIDNIFFKNGKKYCTHNLICQKSRNSCIFEGCCEKNINFFIPLEITRYY